MDADLSRISQPEHPYSPQSTPMQAYQARERNFASTAENQLDQFIAQAQNLLGDLTDQHGILKVLIEWERTC